jgi:hypothetical protein
MSSGKIQVGVYQATYGDISGYASFRDFRFIKRGKRNTDFLPMMQYFILFDIVNERE